MQEGFLATLRRSACLLLDRLDLSRALLTGISPDHLPDSMAHGRGARSDCSSVWAVVHRTRKNKAQRSSCAYRGPFALLPSAPLRHCSVFGMFALLCPSSTPPPHGGASSPRPPGSLFFEPFQQCPWPALSQAGPDRHSVR